MNPCANLRSTFLTFLSKTQLNFQDKGLPEEIIWQNILVDLVFIENLITDFEKSFHICTHRACCWPTTFCIYKL